MSKARGGASGKPFKHAVALPVTFISAETKPFLDKNLPVPVFMESKSGSMQDVRGDKAMR